MSNRDNKVAAGELRELVGMDFDELTRQAPNQAAARPAKFAKPVDITVLQFSNESHPLFHQQRERLMRALRDGWQRKTPDTEERQREMTEVVRRLRGGEATGATIAEPYSLKDWSGRPT